MNEELIKTKELVASMMNEINDKMFEFITKANELVGLSEDDYQIEKTLDYNKISLKSYVLTSPCAVSLREKNIANYSIDQIKTYLQQYEEASGENMQKYYIAVELYEFIEGIEKKVDEKVDLEINTINKIDASINNVKSAQISEYNKLYLNVKNSLDTERQNSKIDDATYNVYINLLHDVFDFYYNGYPTISDEYIYKIKDNEKDELN